MCTSRRRGQANTLLFLLAVAAPASARLLNPDGELIRQGLYQSIVPGNSSSILFQWPGLTGTAFPAQQPATSSPESHASQTALATPESHSSQTAIVQADGSSTMTATTSPLPALAVTQQSPTPAQTSTSPASQSTSSVDLVIPEVQSGETTISSQPLVTPSGLSAGGTGIVIAGTPAPVTPSILEIPQSGSSATSTISGSSSSPYTESVGMQQSTATGSYALVISPSGNIGLQALSTTTTQAETPIAEVHTSDTLLAGIPTVSTGFGTVIPPSGSTENGGVRPPGPLATAWSNGTAGGNSTRGNSSTIIPYVGAASRGDSGASKWWSWMMGAVAMAVL